ncbi:MAG: AraC family transcriptional regulator [Proteobacteria bacterium]|nr:AraC family transcriptional regulator [Pseudomonadota bacterium]
MTYDALSDVLRAIRLHSAVFYDVNAGDPWVAEAPRASVIASAVMPQSEHVIQFHVVTQGGCWATLLPEARSVLLSPGDVVAFPHGDAHVMSSAPGMRAIPNLDASQRPEAPDRLPIAVHLGGSVAGGEAPRNRVLCGFLGCDVRPFNPLLDALPRMLHMHGKDGSGWIARFVEFARLETSEKRAGSASMLAKLGEIMFVDLVRHYVAGLPEGSTNWLVALGDRHVGRAIGLIHESPGQDWTLDRLAREVGLSRSSLAERFQRYVGKPPMQYLTLWRMQIASSLLTDGRASIARVAAEIGYESEAAFSRAFKRALGTSPSLWRERQAVAAPPKSY